MHILSARLQTRNKIVLLFDQSPGKITAKQVTLTPRLAVRSCATLENMVLLHTADADVRVNYTVLVRGVGTMPVIPDGVLDGFVSTKPLGCTHEDGGFSFRVYAPRASAVTLEVYRSLDEESGDTYALTRDEDGVWEIYLSREIEEPQYCFRIDGPRGHGDMFDPSVPVADPYATAVVTRAEFRHRARSLLPTHVPPFDWRDDAPVRVEPRDLVMCEMHVRDMTMHPSSGVPEHLAGTYSGLVHPDARGGIAALKSLGINAVELLPCQRFASVEPPYNTRAEGGWYNTWNPYERNHWGYMTSHYFTPEARYATGVRPQPGAWIDTGAREIPEFKGMVRAFHEAGIAVIMDVVYNHTSQYDIQALKHLDAKYYYRVDEHGRFTGASGCGNDVQTARPMVRRLIVDSVLFWMREYHVDGFRFDLAAMIDQDTFEVLVAEARSINPDVILVAEPWGGGQYDLRRFSALGMSAWNDMFRNGVKGSHPTSGRGYLFGTWGANSSEAFGQWILGSVESKGGPFIDAGHSVNYLASHDGYTLGDFIRIATGGAQEHRPVGSREDNARLTSEQLRINRLAALMLFASQGAVMLHQGQEFGWSKVIADHGIRGTVPGILDHNSYEKDDETNWLDWHGADLNAELVEYYRGLAAVRRAFPELRRSPVEAYAFFDPDADIAGGFVIAGTGAAGRSLAVLVNPNTSQDAHYPLPPGRWSVLVDAARASLEPLRQLDLAPGDVVRVPAGTGMMLVRESAAR